MASISSIEVTPATTAQRAVVANLMQLYLHDLSALDDADVDQSGLFTYEWLPHYWMEEEPHRHPFLITVTDQWAGLALVRSGDPGIESADHDMAEFFVLRKYRR